MLSNGQHVTARRAGGGLAARLPGAALLYTDSGWDSVAAVAAVAAVAVLQAAARRAVMPQHASLRWFHSSWCQAAVADTTGVSLTFGH